MPCFVQSVLVRRVSSARIRSASLKTRNARKVAEPTPDEHEELVVEIYPAREVPDLLRTGEIHHALAFCALSLFWLSRDAG
jgi:hypothetical protein